VERGIELEEIVMNQQQRAWKFFGHVFTTSELGIFILMCVAFLCGIAGIWVDWITNVPLALALVGVGILVWRTAMKHKVIRIALLVLETFIWTSALAGGIGMVQGVAFGQALPLAWLAGTSFSDFTIPGLVLVMVVGGWVPLDEGVSQSPGKSQDGQSCRKAYALAGKAGKP
jgi:hypothetical protein